MRARNTIILLVIALAIGAYIYFFERKTLTTDEAKKLQKNVLRVKSDEVEKIQLTRDGTSIICEKKIDGTWEMTHPLKTKADSSQVRGILSRVASLRKERELDLEPGKAGEYGLEKPEARLRLWHGDKVSEIEVGSETPLGNNIYIGVEGDRKAYVVAKSFSNTLDKSVKDLRDKTIIDVAVPMINRIKVTREGKETEVLKEGEHWKLVSPVRDRADDEKANGTLNKLKNLRAVEFVADGPADLDPYGLSSPPLEVAVYSGEEMAAKKVAFGSIMEGDSEKVYAKREGIDTIYAVRRGVVDSLVKDIEKLRSENLFRAKKGDIEAVTVSHGGEAFELKKDGADWKIVKPVQVDAERTRVDSLLRVLTQAKVKEFVDSGEAGEDEYGLAEPVTTVTLKLKGGVSEGLALGKSGKELCYVEREGGEAILGADKHLEQELAAGYLAYIKKEILSFDREKVEGLTLKRGDGEFVCVRGEDGEWSFSNIEGKEPEGKKLDSILVRLSRLRAKSFVAQADENLKQYGLAKPRVEAVVAMKDGGKHALLVSKERKGVHYAMLRDGRFVFTVPKSLFDSLTVDVVSRKKPKESKEEEKKAE